VTDTTGNIEQVCGLLQLLVNSYVMFNLKERDNLEDLDVDGILLKWIVKKYGMAWT
jgi:hypothetical protein